MNDVECLKILKEMELDYQKQLQDLLQNDYTIWKAERYLKAINYILDTKVGD